MVGVDPSLGGGAGGGGEVGELIAAASLATWADRGGKSGGLKGEGDLDRRLTWGEGVRGGVAMFD